VAVGEEQCFILADQVEAGLAVIGNGWRGHDGLLTGVACWRNKPGMARPSVRPSSGLGDLTV
jgi:hypothetical protein